MSERKRQPEEFAFDVVSLVLEQEYSLRGRQSPWNQCQHVRARIKELELIIHYATSDVTANSSCTELKVCSSSYLVTKFHSSAFGLIRFFRIFS